MGIYNDWLAKFNEVKDVDNKLHEQWLQSKRKKENQLLYKTRVYLPGLLWGVCFLAERLGYFKEWGDIINILIMSGIFFFPLLFPLHLMDKIYHKDCGLDSYYNPLPNEVRSPMIKKSAALGIAVVTLDELIEKNLIVAADYEKALIAMLAFANDKLDHVIIDDHLCPNPELYGIFEGTRALFRPTKEKRYWENYFTAELFIQAAESIRKR